jgi:AcrR family transcriptional regulator
MTTETEQGTVEALLAAALALFAEHGYEGASVRAITARAGANLGAITYHFGSKQALYERVLERCYGPLVERVEAVVRGAGTALERAESVVRTYFDYMSARPELPCLFMRELAAGHEVPRPVSAAIRRLHGTLAGLVVEGQREGTMRAGVAPIMAIGIVSQPLHFGALGGTLREATGIDPADPASREEIVRQVVAFVRAGLAAHGEEGR